MSQTLTTGTSNIGEVVERMKAGLNEHGQRAAQFVEDAIAAVRSAPDADPAWTDEEICQRIVDQIREATPGLRI